MNDISCSRWSRPQYLDPNQRRKRSPRSDQQYMHEDYILSNDFQTFSLDSPPGQDYRFGDLYGLSNPVGHFGSNPSLGAYARNNYPHQHSFLSDLQTYHGANPYSTYRQNFTSDNMRPGAEVMLGETSRSYYKPCSKDRTNRMRSKLVDAQEDLKKGSEGNSTSKSKQRGESKNRMCVGSDEYKGVLGKRKSDQTDDCEVQAKKPKFYFEREEHYVVHKLLRELSSASMPSDLPRTTSASLFYRLLSSKAEPRVMQTVGGSSSYGRSRKVVVRDDVSEDQVSILKSLFPLYSLRPCLHFICFEEFRLRFMQYKYNVNLNKFNFSCLLLRASCIMDMKQTFTFKSDFNTSCFFLWLLSLNKTLVNFLFLFCFL